MRDTIGMSIPSKSTTTEEGRVLAHTLQIAAAFLISEGRPYTSSLS